MSCSRWPLLIATEVDRHADLAIAAATAGKHVLVEKPMALDAAQCRAMIAAASHYNVHLAVAYYVRFFEKSTIMKRVSARSGGNLLADIGSHRLDLLTYLLGRPRRVTGLVDRLTMPYDAADTETTLVQLQRGTHVTVQASANVPARLPFDSTVELFGTRGCLITDPWSDAPVHVLGTDLPPLSARRPTNAHAPMIDDSARAIASGRAPRFTGTDGMWATAVIAGTYESARTGRTISLDR